MSVLMLGFVGSFCLSLSLVLIFMSMSFGMIWWLVLICPLGMLCLSASSMAFVIILFAVCVCLWGR